MSDRIKKYPHPEEAAQRLSRGTHSADPAARQSFRSLGGCVMSGPIAGRNDSCPCGSGRKFKKCCGAAHPAPASASPPRGARPVRLNLSPLSEAGELREAAEALRQSMHGVPTARLNAGNAAGARRTAGAAADRGGPTFSPAGGRFAPGREIAGRRHRPAPGDPARPGGCRIAPRARPGIVAQRPPRRGNRQLRGGDRSRRRGRDRPLSVSGRLRPSGAD
jgi:hypothetical protein